MLNVSQNYSTSVNINNYTSWFKLFVCGQRWSRKPTEQKMERVSGRGTAHQLCEEWGKLQAELLG